MQMLDETCSNNTEIASGQRKRRRRGKLLYSSKRVLERSRMRANKHMSRLTPAGRSVGVRIDFDSEEVTNLASLQEVVTPDDAPQYLSEDNVKVMEGFATRPIVRHYPSIPVSMPIACKYYIS